MRTSVRLLAGAAVLTASMMGVAAPAFAADNDASATPAADAQPVADANHHHHHKAPSFNLGPINILNCFNAFQLFVSQQQNCAVDNDHSIVVPFNVFGGKH
jgi:hypothetical protein